MSPVLTREQVRQVDRIATEEYGILGIVLMENAGRNATSIILDALARGKDWEPTGPIDRVVIFCGTGNNAGDGFVVARHLVNARINVLVALAADPQRLAPDAAVNHRICASMKIPMVEADACELTQRDLVVDALLGTGFRGQVREPPAGLIHRINEAPKAGVIAIDVPSGLDCDQGVPSNATVVADATVTFVANKIGFLKDEAHPYVGRVYVVDIGAPSSILESVLDS